MRVLFLCDGDTHTFDEPAFQVQPGTKVQPLPCLTAGIPLSLEIYKQSDTMDISKRTKPTIVQDISKKIPTNKMDVQYDVITTMCCSGDLFAKPSGLPVKSSWNNVERLLKPGGYFILQTPEKLELSRITLQPILGAAKTRILKRLNHTPYKHLIWDKLSLFRKPREKRV